MRAIKSPWMSGTRQYLAQTCAREGRAPRSEALLKIGKVSGKRIRRGSHVSEIEATGAWDP